MTGRVRQNIIVALASAFLVLCYISIGYAVCANVPCITEAIASTTIDDSSSPFEKSQLVDAASEIRAYSFGSHDVEQLKETVSQINNDALTPYADVSSGDIAEIPDRYAITSDQLEHLDDVYRIAQNLRYPIFGAVIIAIFLLLVGSRMFGPSVIARSLKISGIITVAFIAALGIFALISFNGFFSAFHSVFFDDGSWTFPADSLLITALPEDFWATMAAVWGIISLIVGAASIVVGFMLGRRLYPRAE